MLNLRPTKCSEMGVPSFLKGRSEEEANLVFKARKEKGKSVFERGSQHISLVQNAPAPLEISIWL